MCIKLCANFKGQPMKKNRAESKIVLDTRRRKKDGSYPAKLKITYKRERKYYNTTYNLTEEEWNAVHEANNRGDNRKIKLALAAIETSAQACCGNIKEFTFNAFEKAFFPKSVKSLDLGDAYKQYIDQLKSEDRYGTADNYNSSMISLLKYKKRLKLTDITPHFLKEYEKSLLGEGKSPSTIGIYLRPLRAIINKAMEEDSLSRDYYPFGKGKYQIPTGRNIKKALSKEELIQIINYKPPVGSSQEFYKDLWLFSFFCNGMNVADICHLQNKNIQDGFLIYQRKKTINKYKSNPKYIKVPITDYIQGAINNWRSRNNSPEAFLFPILNHSMTAFSKKKRTKEITHNLNDNMKTIASQLKINHKITSLTARHSFATTMKRLGASTELISESFGHSSVMVTNNYLDSFEETTIKHYASLLQNINKT